MDKIELDKRWKEAVAPNAHLLEGWYKVNILSGHGQILGWFVKCWLKVLRKNNGNNCVDGKKEGHFLLSQGPDYVIFNYNLPQNSFAWRQVLDHIRQEKDGVLLGKLHVKFWSGCGPIKWLSGHRFQGYFTLTKKNKELDHVQECTKKR